jgi:hypothetical protein
MTTAPRRPFVFAKIWESIQPIARGDRYEDPLQEELEKRGLGEVTGGGSSYDKAHGISYVGVDIELGSLDDLDLVKRVLEGAGAPKGSELQFEREGRREVMPFGVTEGLAIWLDGISLPDAIYEQADTDALADSLWEILKKLPGSEIRGSWQGPEETAIYIYGMDAEAMFSAIEPVLRAYPQCQNARVVIRHGNPALGPREVRMPRDPSGGGAARD